MADTKTLKEQKELVFEDESLISECLEMFDACVHNIEVEHEVTGKSA